VSPLGCEDEVCRNPGSRAASATDGDNKDEDPVIKDRGLAVDPTSLLEPRQNNRTPKWNMINWSG